MEPIRLWRRNFLRGTQPMWVDEEPKHPAYFQDFVAVRCHEYDALVKERDEARRQRDGMTEQYESAMEIIHRNAGARRDGLCGILAWIDEAKDATARDGERDEKGGGK